MRYPGFTSGIPGEHTLEVAGEFGFQVSIRDEDWDGQPHEPEIAVGLPHQCDAWEIVSNCQATQIDGAISTMERFVTEAQAALDVLRKMREFNIPESKEKS